MLSMDSALPRARIWPPLPRLRPRGPFVLLALATLGLSGYLLLPPTIVALPRIENCRLEQAACGADLGAGSRIAANLGPRPISPAAPLAIEIRLEGLQAKSVQAVFRGASMNMGAHEISLAAQGDGSFLGQAVLPVCVSGRMVWEVTIDIGAGRKIYRQAFLFESGA